MSVLNWPGILSPAVARLAPGEPAEDLVALLGPNRRGES